MTEVGKISIRVSPDLKHFWEELKGKLEEVERGLKGQIQFKADFDANGLKSKVEAAARGAKAHVEVKADLDKLWEKRMLADLAKSHKKLETTIPLTPDGERFRRLVAEDVKKTEHEIKGEIPMDLKLAAGQRQRLLADVEVVKRLAEETPIRLKLDEEGSYRIHQRVAKIKMKPEMDQTEFAKVLAETRAAANTAGVRLHVGFHNKEAEAHLASLIGRLKAEAAAAHIKLHVRTDKVGVFERLFQRFERGGGGRGGFGGGQLDQLFNFGSLPNLVAIFSLLPPALAILAPALTSLPALIAGVAAPIGVLALGLGGLKKAAESAGILSPVLDKHGNPKGGKVTVSGALKDLKDGVSDVFAKGFTPIFNQLLQAAGPAKTALKGIAQGIVNLASGLAKTLTSPAVMNQLNTLFANIGGALSASAPGISSFTTGLINLATQVSTHFPGLAAWFNKLGDRFSTWVSKISKDGTLDKAISSMRPVLDELIGFVGRLVDAGLKLASNPEMGKGIGQVLDGLNNFIINSLPDLANFFNSIAPLIGLLGRGKPGTYPGLTPGQPGQPQQPPPHRLGQNSWFPGFLPEAGQNAKNVLQFANLPLLATSHLGGIVNGAKGLASKVTGELQKLPGQVAGIWKKLVAPAQEAFNEISKAAQQKTAEVISVFRALPGKILGILANLGSQLFSAGASAMGRLADGVRSAVGSVTGAVKGALGGILNLIPHSPAPEGPFSAAGWNQLFTGGQSVANQFKTGLEDGFDGVIRSATDLLGQVNDALSSGTLPPGLRQNIRDELRAIGTEYDTLRVRRDALDPKDKTGRKAISEQLKQLQGLRDRLHLGRDYLPQDQKSNIDKNLKQGFSQLFQRIPEATTNFAMANINQLESDLGVSGRGAIPTIANIGIGWASQMAGNLVSGLLSPHQQSQSPVQIHVNSVDEAMQARQNILNKQALGIAGR